MRAAGPHKEKAIGWNKYSGDNSRTLYVNVLKCERIADGKHKEWYWFDKVASIMNKKFIDVRSNNRGLCRKQYMSETV